MQFFRILFAPLGLFYWVITTLRNGFYNRGIFKASKFSIPIINLGNLSVGGTGKTPHTEYLIRLLKDEYKVATLSRGFGRKERGFIIANEESTYKQIGDEPMQYYKKYGEDIKVVVEANRVKGVMDLMHEHEDTEVVLLDDAYQHRAIHRGLNILITTHDKPYFKDYILPLGDLRESRKGSSRADLVIVSKCVDFEKVKRDFFIHKIAPDNPQKVFFSKINYANILPFFPSQEIGVLNGKKIILVSGIANAEPLKKYLQDKAEIIHHFNYKDHHNFKPEDLRDIHGIFGKFADRDPIILTTEKDAMRLIVHEFEEELKNYPWYYQSIEIEIDRKEEFDQIIKNYVETNRRNH